MLGSLKDPNEAVSQRCLQEKPNNADNTDSFMQIRLKTNIELTKLQCAKSHCKVGKCTTKTTMKHILREKNDSLKAGTSYVSPKNAKQTYTKTYWKVMLAWIYA